MPKERLWRAAPIPLPAAIPAGIKAVMEVAEMIPYHRPHVPRTTLRDMVAALIASPDGVVMLLPFVAVFIAALLGVAFS